MTGSDSSAFGARVQIYRAPTQVVAIQALIQPPIGSLPGQTSGADIRLMFGQSFVVGGVAGFIDIEPGGRFHGDPYPNEARLDIAAGIRPFDALLILVQEFGSLAPSRGPVIPRQSYSKGQVSLVYDLSATWSVQVGAFQTIAGRNAIRERGPVVALWYRF